MRIVLARHGRPNLRDARGVVPREMGKWIESYNNADVLLEGVPQETFDAARESGVVVASTLRRSMQSADYLSNGRTLPSEQVFCEAGLPYAHWYFPRLPASAWAAFFRLAWFLGYSTNAESVEHAEVRAQAGAERLIHLANQHDSVFLVGHGIMMTLIAKHLLARGWAGPVRPAHDYWQISTYHAAAYAADPPTHRPRARSDPSTSSSTAS